MKEYSAAHPNGVDKVSRVVLTKGPFKRVARYMDESIITTIPARFTGGFIEGSNMSFNQRLVWKPKAEQMPDNFSQDSKKSNN